MIIHKFNQKGYDTYKRIVEDIQSSVEKENNDISKGYTKELKKELKIFNLTQAHKKNLNIIFLLR